eukprot:TRINITY_DN6025_c0_g3_i1.p1 TRINITY_DN6025_c0_g3~~TRINITY_DN6025_c0_g3_i1.p1  ORF type:complete len:347 (-),score=99.85 TRINITY_DN6025_c0_g3_i1:244-1284(-)
MLTKQVASLTRDVQLMAAQRGEAQAEVGTLQRKCEQLQSMRDSERVGHRISIQEVGEQAKRFEQTLKLKERELSDLKQGIGSMGHRKRDREDSSQIQVLQLPPTGIDPLLVEQLRNDLARTEGKLQQTERALGLLEARKENAQMLQESNHSLKAKIKRLEEDNDGLRKDAAQADPVGGAGSQWVSVLGRLGTPVEILNSYTEMEARIVLQLGTISDLQHANCKAQIQAGTWQAALAQAQRDAESAEEALAEQRAECSKLQRERAELATKVQCLTDVVKWDVRNGKPVSENFNWDAKWAAGGHKASLEQAKLADSEVARIQADLTLTQETVRQLRKELASALATSPR